VRTSTLGWLSLLSIVANVVVIPVDLIMLFQAGRLPEPGSQPAAAPALPAQPQALPPPPPPAPAQPAVQAGWYDDPKGESRLRYWDGAAWTDQTAA
jgi:hypothetical protein